MDNLKRAEEISEEIRHLRAEIRARSPVRKRRKALNLTQKQLSHSSGVSIKRISKIEWGEYPNIRGDVARELSRVLSVETKQLHREYKDFVEWKQRVDERIRQLVMELTELSQITFSQWFNKFIQR